MKTWCKERGTLVPLPIPDIFVTEKDTIDPTLIKEWEEAYASQFWVNRSAWFKKPMACLQSPYLKSIWIDSDCEIKGPLKPLFSFCDLPPHFAIAEELNNAILKGKGFNSGVLVFKRGIALMEEWAEQAFSSNHLFPGDQDILSALILEKKIQVQVLPRIYNWSRCNEINPKAIIVHWHGRHGKTTISHQIARSHFEIYD
jgi:hypothetical protein